MATHQRNLTAAELFWTILFSAVPAVLVAIIAFVGAIFFWAWLFRGPMSEWALVFAPATGLFFGATAFLIAFRWISQFGHTPGGHHSSGHPRPH
jgi:hypothetical protein